MTHLELLKDVWYVGYVDFEVRNFHGYSTHRGSSYNAYLVKSGDKTVLIDTVKRPYFEHFLDKIKHICDPAEIDYLIMDHIEMDHSGSFPLILKHLPNAEIIASFRGVDILKSHFHQEVDAEVFDRIRAVKNGDTLDIGNGKKFTFVPIPMIHWPDSMVAFMTDDNGKNVLFSSDAFGQHIATTMRWDDENDMCEIMEEAEKYYANILLHLSELIAKTLPVVGALPIDVVCTAHGVCWRKNIPKILEKYRKWSTGEIEGNSVLIVYDTMWESTAKIAKALTKEIRHRGIQVKRFRLTQADYSDVITEAMKAKAILIGSPTLNNGLYPSVAEYLCYQKGLKPMNKVGLAFGSYGWSGQATQEIVEQMKAAGIDVMDEMIKIKFVPKPEDLDFKEIVDKLIDKMK
ncbi:MAG: flavodoxin domain-containing protein [Candidatus Lokiarchaeota archaeon]|nr:flavodoxin domain-containing protein [Candidatus Lokiarchaeota archaeon]